jgi:hypothetical protein
MRMPNRSPDNLMAPWQFSELDVLAPPERQLPIDLMQTRIRQSPVGEHCAAWT